MWKLDTRYQISVSGSRLLVAGNCIYRYPISCIRYPLSRIFDPDMNKPIYPCLWFDGQAHEAAAFYCSVFKNAKITADNPMVTMFEVNGQQFMCLNGGPHFQFNEAVSFVIDCETQEEIDYYWNKLTEGGSESMCGWLKDQFGVSWQVVPSILGKLMSDPEKGQRVVAAFMKMKKFDIQTLLDA
jgi:predicted 3-demethylubiquinone-9 3-methyltransferase (glyoxalase superfamily)